MTGASEFSGLPIVLSAPSGGGKSTIADRVLKEAPHLVRSISCTTRSPRTGEVHGQHYFFVSESEFKNRVSQGEFIEWAQVHGHYYGTPKPVFEQHLRKGHDVLLVIDPQGALSIKRLYPEGLFIFIVPPTWEDLMNRLSVRGTDSSAEREKRLANAKMEISALPQYDFLVVNDNVDAAVGDVLAILRSEHRRLNRVNKADIPILSSL